VTFWLAKVLLADTSHANGTAPASVTTSTSSRAPVKSPAPAPTRATTDLVLWVHDHFEIAGLVVGLATLLFTIIGVAYMHAARNEARRREEQEERRRNPVSQAQLVLDVDARIGWLSRAFGELDTMQLRILALRGSLFISQHDPLRLDALAFGNNPQTFEEYNWEMDRLLSSVHQIDRLIDQALADLYDVQHESARGVSAQLLTLQNLLSPIAVDPMISFERVQALLGSAIGTLSVVRGLGPEQRQP